MFSPNFKMIERLDFLEEVEANSEIIYMNGILPMASLNECSFELNNSKNLMLAKAAFMSKDIELLEAVYKDHIVWRAIFTTKDRVSELISFETVNQQKTNYEPGKQNRLYESFNIPTGNIRFSLKESAIPGLGKKLFNEYIDILNERDFLWAEFLSVETAVQFYKKTLNSLLEEGKIYGFYWPDEEVEEGREDCQIQIPLQYCNRFIVSLK